MTVGATAGLICILVALSALLFGIKPLVFRSGSMGPTIQTGALGLAKTVPASELEVGDVVSVVNDSGTRITHRINAIDHLDGNGARVTLKGDANEQADLIPYTVTEADRVFFHVNGLGYAVTWLSSPIATFLGGVLVGAVLLLAFGPNSRRDEEASVETIDPLAEADQELQGAHRG